MAKYLRALTFFFLVSVLSVGTQSCMDEDIIPIEIQLSTSSDTQDDDEPTEEEIP